MHLRARAIAAALLGWSVAPGPAAATDALYRAGDWALELFGRDVAILRAALVASSGQRGLLLLSCVGGESRLRLALGEPRAALAGSYRVLIRPAGAPRGEPPLLARLTQEGSRTLTLAETAAAGPGVVERLTRALRLAPPALDLMLAAGDRPTSLRQQTTWRLSLSVSPRDAIALDGFAFACRAARERESCASGDRVCK